MDQLDPQLRELGRMRPHTELAARLTPLVPTLLQIAATETEALENAVERSLRAAQVVEMTAALFADTRRLKSQFGLSSQDAMVLASVVADLGAKPKEVPKCFISRNSKDFDDPSLVGMLESANCHYIRKFTDGLSYIRNVITTR